VARVRLAEGHDPPPPQMIWENPRHPRVEQLLQRLPAGARRAGDVLTRIRALASWLSMSWEHTSSARAALYTPWDAETILAWGKTQTGPNGQRPIVMCVHYAVAFVSFCQALRIPARCAVLMGTPNGTDGHFVAEVWMDDLRKWIMVDPNCDVLFFKDGEPLSIPEIRSLGDSLEPYAVTGSGSRFQSTFPHMASFYRDNLFKGLCFRHRSVWPRTDFLSHPEYAPPGHGSTSYCETDLVWEETDLAAGFGMFRSFAPPEYFDAPPSMPH
jgi:hypothetical protein